MPNRKRFNTQISCPISVESKELLEKIALETNATVSQHVRYAIEDYLKACVQKGIVKTAETK